MSKDKVLSKFQPCAELYETVNKLNLNFKMNMIILEFESVIIFGSKLWNKLFCQKSSENLESLKRSIEH